MYRLFLLYFSLVDENAGLKCRVLEVEASLGSQEALTELSGELAQLRQRNEILGSELRTRDEEIEALRSGVPRGPHGDALKVRFHFALFSKIFLKTDNIIQSKSSKFRERRSPFKPWL